MRSFVAFFWSKNGGGIGFILVRLALNWVCFFGVRGGGNCRNTLSDKKLCSFDAGKNWVCFA